MTGSPRKRPLSLSTQDSFQAINPNQVLQVRQDATPAEIRNAYRRLALWHHPGRGSLEGAELYRRIQIFILLAACYETLQAKAAPRPSTVGLRESVSLARKEPESFFSDSRSSDGDEASFDYSSGSSIEYIASSDFTGSRSTDEDPLESLRERHGKPFSNPYDVFDQVLGSKPFRRVPLHAPSGIPRLPRSPPSAAWTGTTKVLDDGSRISTTSRILHDRKLTRTELRMKNSKGQQRILVTVVGEDLQREPKSKPVARDCFERSMNCVSDIQSWEEWSKESLDKWTVTVRSCGSWIPE